MRRAGITLIEVLVVISLTALISAMLMPAIFAAKGAATRTTCVSNLRQIGMAIQLYRQGWADDAVAYGHPYMMGLPPTAGVLEDVGLIAKFRCKGRDFRGGATASYEQMWPSFAIIESGLVDEAAFDVLTEEWARYATIAQANSILVIDPNHGNVTNSSLFVTHKCVGLFEDGSVRTRSGKGRPNRLDWWNP